MSDIRTIFKYPIKITDRQAVKMPAGARILTVQMQGGGPQLWVLCDPENKDEKRIISIYGTGQAIDLDPGRYIGTFQVLEGVLVYHVFEARCQATSTE